MRYIYKYSMEELRPSNFVDVFVSSLEGTVSRKRISKKMTVTRSKICNRLFDGPILSLVQARQLTTVSY